MGLAKKKNDQLVIICLRRSPGKGASRGVRACVRRAKHSNGPKLLLLDWSGLNQTACGEPADIDKIAWVEAGVWFRRIALLHDRRWNRAAAYISALLRAPGAEVRSFATIHRAEAISWLCACH